MSVCVLFCFVIRAATFIYCSFLFIQRFCGVIREAEYSRLVIVTDRFINVYNYYQMSAPLISSFITISEQATSLVIDPVVRESNQIKSN